MDKYIPTLISATDKYFRERVEPFELELSWTYGDNDILHDPTSLSYTILDSDGSHSITKGKSYEDIRRIHKKYRNISTDARDYYNLNDDSTMTIEGHPLLEPDVSNKYLFGEGFCQPRFVKYSTTLQDVRDEYPKASIATMVTDHFRGIHVGDRWTLETDGFMTVEIYAPSIEVWESFIKDENLDEIHKKPGFAKLLKMYCAYIIFDGKRFDEECYGPDEGFVYF